MKISKKQLILTIISARQIWLRQNVKDTLRKDFFRLRDQEKYIESLKEQEEINQQHLHRYEANTAQKDQYILELQGKIEELNETCKNLFSDMKKSSSQYEQGHLKEYQKGVEEKEALHRRAS